MAAVKPDSTFSDRLYLNYFNIFTLFPEKLKVMQVGNFKTLHVNAREARQKSLH